MGYFAKIAKTRELRVSILETAKETVRCLAKQKNVDEIRQQKKKLLDEVKADITELHLSCSELNEYLPYKELKTEAEKEERAKAKAEAEREAYIDEKHLEEKLSKLRKQAPPKKEPVKIEEPPEKEETPLPETSTLSDLDRLEYTLRKIEGKLAELNQ